MPRQKMTIDNWWKYVDGGMEKADPHAIIAELVFQTHTPEEARLILARYEAMTDIQSVGHDSAMEEGLNS